ncbi:MAG: CpaE family protein [Atopobiaceae bacterium]
MKWLAYARKSYQGELEAKIRAEYPGSSVSWASSPEEMREALAHGLPGQYAAAVGPVRGMQAPINLAAALAHDAHATLVVLAQPAPSGSLRSRASQAGITRVMALDAQREEVGQKARDEATRAQVRHTKAETGALPLEQAEIGDLDEVESASMPARRDAQPKKASALKMDKELPRIDPGFAHAPNPCPVLCVASGRGGVGKTALSCLMAATAARWGLKVSLMDFDLACGNAYACFGLPGPAALDQNLDIHADAKTLAAQGKVASEGISLWGPCLRPENAELVAPQAGNLLELVCRQSDLVIVDCATAWTDAVAQAAQMCDRLLLVCPESGGAASSLSRVGALAVRLGVARTRIVRVVNLANPKRTTEAFIDRADVGLEAARTFRVMDGGEETDELLMAGHVVELSAQDSELSRSVASCLAQVLQELGRLPDCNDARRALEMHEHAQRRGFFGRRKEAM